MCYVKSSLPNFNIEFVQYFLILCIFSGTIVFGVSAETEKVKVMIGLGQAEIIEFMDPIKRISIADPEVADANVTSPRQIVVNGKSLGSTTMIVWDEIERYTIYKVVVHSEALSHQVMLRVRFAEVNRGALKELGINFLAKNQKVGSELVNIGSFAGKVTQPNDPLQIDENVDIFLAVPTQNISAIIKALEEKSLLTTLAKPNLSAISGSEASFHVGGEIPIPILSGSTGQVTITYKSFGIKLKFIPTVLDSELVNIQVSTEVSGLDFANGIIISGFQIPALITRKTETTVELRDGEHFVIGGLISNEMAKTVTKIPVLGHIPILGKLFSSTRFQNRESELIIMIAPQIIQSMREDSIPEIQIK